jgi:hypothetical protein
MKPNKVLKIKSLLLILLCMPFMPLGAQSVSSDLFSGLK